MKSGKDRKAQMAGRIGAYRRVSKPGYDGREATKAATSASWAAREARVDPDGTLDPEERHRRAVRDWQADMLAAKMKKMSAKRGRGR